MGTEPGSVVQAMMRDETANNATGVYRSKKTAFAKKDPSIKWQAITENAKIWIEKLVVTPAKPHGSNDSHLLASNVDPTLPPNTSFRPAIRSKFFFLQKWTGVVVALIFFADVTKVTVTCK